MHPPKSISNKFKKENRILKSSRIKYILKHGKAARRNWLILHKLQELQNDKQEMAKKSINYSRLGILVSKKHIKKAVGRNRFKRILREYFRKSKNTFIDNFDIVVEVIGEPTLNEKLFYKNEISKLFINSGIL